jgi:hypothetical protein
MRMRMPDRDPRKEVMKRAKDLMKLLEDEFKDKGYDIEGFDAELEFGIPHIGKGSLKVKMKRKKEQEKT